MKRFRKAALTGGRRIIGLFAASVPLKCPLSDNSGQRLILAYDSLSVNDPTATFATQKEVSLLQMAAS
jgi:hypothetical protein